MWSRVSEHPQAEGILHGYVVPVNPAQTPGETYAYMVVVGDQEPAYACDLESAGQLLTNLAKNAALDAREVPGTRVVVRRGDDRPRTGVVVAESKGEPSFPGCVSIRFNDVGQVVQYHLDYVALDRRESDLDRRSL